jgi:hypothetical protein
MEIKKYAMFTLLGGAAVLAYMKYKDGSIQRTVRNVKPKVENVVDNLKK